ncbi:MAG: hypothetical protein N4A44_01605 [Alphaproteobacteria bacterium]|jgi:opacity protein-like surface antigen|nr:hypothetical protein [Alphaproteobacteria bacterium]
MLINNKNILTILALSIPFISGGSSSAQYYSNYNKYKGSQSFVGNKPKAGYTSNAQYFNSNTQYGSPYTTTNMQYRSGSSNSYYAPQQPVRVQNTPQKPAPIFVINNTQRMSNPIPGYGEVQNPYTDSSKSGFYLGLGYMNAKDKGDGFVSDTEDAFIPGNWSKDGNNLGKGTGFSISIGTQTSGNTRSELSYNSYSGLEYADFAKGGTGTKLDADSNEVEYLKEYQKESGGGVNVDAFMFNTYYSLENMLGNFLNGMIKPYAGFGFGLGFVKVDDYTLKDTYVTTVSSTVDGQNPECFAANGSVIDCTDVYENGTVKYQGDSSNNFSWNYEVGLSFDAGDNVLLDVFYRKSMYGEISTGGSVTSSYDLSWEFEVGAYEAQFGPCPGNVIQLEDGGPQYCSINMDKSNVTESATESADIELEEIGIKLRTFF